MALSIEKLKQHFEHDDYFAHMLGAMVQDTGPGYAKVVIPLRYEFHNGAGLAHGGVLFTILDLAFGVAANVGRDHVILTAQSSISFLRPGRKGPLTAEARVLKAGTSLAVVDCEVRDAEGTLLATARMTGVSSGIPWEQPCS